MSEEIIERLKDILEEHGPTPPAGVIQSLASEVGRDRLLLALLDFPRAEEEERQFVEHVKNVLKGIVGERPPEAAGVIRLKIAATGRGAVFKLKRAFWAAVSKEKRDAEKSREYWRDFAAKIVQRLNEEGASDKPVRLVLHYDIIENAIRPRKADVEVYEKIKEFSIE